MYNPLLSDYPSGYPMCKKRLKYPVGTTNYIPEKCCLMRRKARPPKNAKTLYQKNSLL